MPFDVAVSLPGIWPYTSTYAKLCLCKNIATLFVIAKVQKQWKCPLLGDWLNNLQQSPRHIISEKSKGAELSYHFGKKIRNTYTFVNIGLEYFWNDIQEAGDSGYIQERKWLVRGRLGSDRQTDRLSTVCPFVSLN